MCTWLFLPVPNSPDDGVCDQYHNGQTHQTAYADSGKAHDLVRPLIGEFSRHLIAADRTHAELGTGLVAGRGLLFTPHHGVCTLLNALSAAAFAPMALIVKAVGFGKFVHMHRFRRRLRRWIRSGGGFRGGRGSRRRRGLRCLSDRLQDFCVDILIQCRIQRLDMQRRGQIQRASGVRAHDLRHP